MSNSETELISNFLVPSLRQAASYKIDAADVTVKLDQNETPFEWPSALKKQVLNKLEDVAWNRYPSPFAPTITEHLARYAQIPAEQILTGPGTNYLITLFMSALTRQIKGKVIIAQPSFPLYEAHCRYEGIPYEIWPLTDDLQYDLDLLPEVPPHSLIAFASPNNPTGNLLSPDQLQTLLASHPRSYVLADEAYFEFAPFNYTSLLQSYPNLIVLRTCSKTLGAAGLRLGYAMARRELIQEVSKLRLPYLLNHFTIAAAEVFFTSDELQLRVSEHVEKTITERERVKKVLEEIAGHKVRVFSSSANFLLIKFPDQNKCSHFYNGLISEEILVRDVSRGPKLTGCLRVTIGTAEENARFLQVSAKLLK